MIEYYKKVGKDEKLEKIEQYIANAWVKVIDPNEEEMKFLVEKFDLDKVSLMDGLDLYEIPRVDEDNGKVYIFLRVPTDRILGEATSSFLIIITKENIITLSRYDLEIFDKIADSKYFFTNRRTGFILQMLFFISRKFNLYVRRILKEVKSDKRNIPKLSNKDILDLVLQEDTLNDYLSSFAPLIDIHNQILKTKSLKFKESQKEFIEDLIVDLNQTFNVCKSALKTISNMRNYYSTTLSNNINKVITVLTIFAVFLTIPAIFSSIYGMNIDLPFQNNPYMFWFLSGAIVLIWVVVFIVLKRRKIL